MKTINNCTWTEIDGLCEEAAQFALKVLDTNKKYILDSPLFAPYRELQYQSDGDGKAVWCAVCPSLAITPASKILYFAAHELVYDVERAEEAVRNGVFAKLEKLIVEEEQSKKPVDLNAAFKTPAMSDAVLSLTYAEIATGYAKAVDAARHSDRHRTYLEDRRASLGDDTVIIPDQIAHNQEFYAKHDEAFTVIYATPWDANLNLRRTMFDRAKIDAAATGLFTTGTGDLVLKRLEIPTIHANHIASL